MTITLINSLEALCLTLIMLAAYQLRKHYQLSIQTQKTAKGRTKLNAAEDKVSVKREAQQFYFDKLPEPDVSVSFAPDLSFTPQQDVFTVQMASTKNERIVNGYIDDFFPTAAPPEEQMIVVEETVSYPFDRNLDDEVIQVAHRNVA